MTSENKTLTPVWIAYVDGMRLGTGYEGALKRIYIHDRLDFAGTASLLFGSSPLDFCNDGTFTIGSEVSIHLGYKDDVQEVFAGEVTGFAPRLDEYSAPLMEVKMHSKLHRLNKGTRCASFERKTPAGIIRDIVQGYNLNADVEEFGPEYNYIEQKNFTDYGYILYLAGKYGKTVYCHGNTVHVKTEITPTDDDVVLEWGKTIISARTKTDLAAQLSAVTATGWNMRKCSGFTATATMKDVPLKIGGEYCWEDNAKGYDPHKVWQLSSSSFTDEKDAMEVARSVLLGRSLQFQSCEAKTEGNCRIRPGNRLTVKYLGRHSDGEYLVYSVEHSLSVQDGYFTICHLKRNFCGVSNNRSISAIDRERIDRQGANVQEENAAATSASGKQTETQNDTEITSAEKTPTISNPRWEDENGKAISKALVGDEVYLCADVTDIADGATATIRIVEKDDDGNDDFVTELSAAVQDGKIRRKWKVIYTEDNDDTDSQKEMEEKGYTLPEYAFTAESSGVKSEESGQLDVMGWIKTQFINKYNKKPLRNMNYEIRASNGSLTKGKTDKNGFIELGNLKFYKYSIRFEDN
ncbi:phage late control D family protein [uncultured Treponema sp.]|uniref:phage late control D family protein n=1 Tax=uncultured Treponema sp. TaxID=162155 RepID=UPI00258908F0|nr:phage late control D family protein [uncultured Treponema sp.]